MGPPSTKKCVVNVDKVYPIKEVIESNVETKDKITRRKISYADIVIHRNKRPCDVVAEHSREH